ncbi:MAG: pilus assembly protein N-terminal domain-containing protein [Parvularculaceae bacterium]
MTNAFRASIAASAAALAAVAAPTAAEAGEIWLTMDYVEPYTLPKAAGQIVVGNPGIADVEVRNDRSLLLFGKGPGVTNLFIYDQEGEKLENLIVRVRALGDNMLTLQQGPIRTTYNCLSICEQTITVGDGQEGFSQTANQIEQKFLQATNTVGQNRNNN